MHLAAPECEQAARSALVSCSVPTLHKAEYFLGSLVTSVYFGKELERPGQPGVSSNCDMIARQCIAERVPSLP
jgi:hypothetical protein